MEHDVTECDAAIRLGSHDLGAAIQDHHMSSGGSGMYVGDLHRVIEYPKLGSATEQEVPTDVLAAYERLRSAGFDSRLMNR